MSVNEDSLGPSSDSFWDIDGYKATVKRQEDGARLCQELMSLIQERAEIEKSYAKNLQNWSKKWMQTIEKGPEYGTTQAAWKGVLHEAESMAQIHTNIKDSLMSEVHQKVKEWKQANYKKAVVGPCKETKQLEEEFKKAQKPWAKKYAKVKETKKQYHSACKMEKSYTNQENNAKADSSLSPDQLKKIQDKAEKCRKEVEVTKQKYEAALTDLNNYNSKYMEDMMMVFAKSDQNEERRLVFFKEMMFGIHKCLDISQNPELPQIYNQLHHTIEQADYTKDLKWWSQNYGKDMAMNWPQFEEFQEDLHDITRQKIRDRDAVGESGITLRHINTDRYHQEFTEYQEGHHPISRKEKTKSHHIGGNDGIMLTGLKTENSQAPPSYNTMSSNGSTSSAQNVTPPQASPNLQRLPSYDSTLNPFATDDDEDAKNTKEDMTSSPASSQSPSKSLENTPTKCTNIPSTHNIPATPSVKLNETTPEDKHDKNVHQDYDNSLNPFGDDDDDDNGEEDSASKAAADKAKSTSANCSRPPPQTPTRTPFKSKSKNQNDNLFGDDELDEVEHIDTSSGVPVRAIYDYVGQEDDELSFKEGDIFMKLKDRDAQGWCTGLKDGRIGLYPDNYVQTV